MKKNICFGCGEPAKIQVQLTIHKEFQVVSADGQRMVKVTPDVPKFCWEHYTLVKTVKWILRHYPENMTDEELVEWDEWLMLYNIANPKNYEFQIYPIIGDDGI